MCEVTPAKRRLIVGITGASGIAYGVRALQMLGELGIERHLIVSRAADMTRAHETDLSREDLHAFADVVHPIGNVGASVASGSFQTLGMLIAPCSMRTLAEIATGLSSTLLSRAADVILKERRKLVLMTREAPLHLVHLRNMLTVTEMGGIIHPPVPALYTRPQTVAEIIDHSVARALDAFGLHSPDLPRWGEDIPALGQGAFLPHASEG